MGAAAQKKKLMCGMSVPQAKRKLLEIFDTAEPGVDFQIKYPGIFTWMETWFRLRSRSETFEMICQAFAEKVARLHKEKRGLEQKVHTQRIELLKRLAEIDALKAKPAEQPTTEGA